MNEFIKDTLTFICSTIKGEGGDGGVSLICRTIPIETVASYIEELKLDRFYSEKLGCEVKIWEREDYENVITFSSGDEGLTLIQGVENFNMFGGNALYDTMIVIF